MNKIQTWVNKHKLLSIIVCLLLIPFILIYKPYKPSNPSNPLFKENFFDLSDYLFRRAALMDALGKLLPVGTDKKDVERILIEYGGADVVDNNSTTKGFFSYTYTPLSLTYDRTRIDVYYNDKNKLEVIMLNRMPINGDFETIKNR